MLVATIYIEVSFVPNGSIPPINLAVVRLFHHQLFTYSKIENIVVKLF